MTRYRAPAGDFDAQVPVMQTWRASSCVARRSIEDPHCAKKPKGRDLLSRPVAACFKKLLSYETIYQSLTQC